MKQRLNILMVLLIILLVNVGTACNIAPVLPPSVAVSGISLNYSESEIFLGGSLQLTATISPSDVTNRNISWSSSDSTIASISDSGLASAKGVGTVLLTATSEDGGFTDSCQLCVHKNIAATDAVSEDYFGTSSAIYGDFAFVGVPGDDETALNKVGSVYIYQRNQGGENTWGFKKRIIASDFSESAQFGKSVAADGDVLVVGAFGDSGFIGAAYVFYRDQGGPDNWGQVAKLSASDGAASDFFGRDVSVSGNYAIIGAYGNDDVASSSGSAYIFYKDQGGIDAWGQLKKLAADTPALNDMFGLGVSISGNYAAVAARNDDEAGSNAGAVYIFYRNAAATENSWGRVAQLTAEADAVANLMFGGGVAISGDDLIVSAGQDSTDGLRSGAAYIFNRNQGSADNWGRVTRITASDGADNDDFGWPLVISGDYAVVGVYGADVEGKTNAGAAYVYFRNQGGANNWGEKQKLVAISPEQEDWFSSSLGFYNNTVMVGVSHEDSGTVLDTGSVYLFSIY